MEVLSESFKETIRHHEKGESKCCDSFTWSDDSSFHSSIRTNLGMSDSMRMIPLSLGPRYSSDALTWSNDSSVDSSIRTNLGMSDSMRMIPLSLGPKYSSDAGNRPSGVAFHESAVLLEYHPSYDEHCSISSHQNSCRIIASVVKKKSASWGVTFKRRGSALVIEEISEASPFYKTRLEVGDLLVSINGEKSISTLKEAKKCFKSSNLRGTIEVIQGEGLHDANSAQDVFLEVEKESRDCVFGIGLKKESDGEIYITRSSGKGLLGSLGPLIPVGGRLSAVNGDICPDTVKEVIKTLQEPEASMVVMECRVAGGQQTDRYVDFPFL